MLYLADENDNPIFGVPLAVAVERNKSHDGIELPAIVRECIDYIEECGMCFCSSLISYDANITCS